MSFDWLHYLDLAQELCEQAENSGHRDANLRSSISRAYYATYHKSRQLLKDKWGIATSKDSNSHQQVQDEFNKQNQKEIAEHLCRMRRNRNNADYKDKYRNIERVAQDNIWRAKQVLSFLNQL
jgi:uncharacterized protein (UPF0332 family)